jgi:hypothetical protein
LLKKRATTTVVKRGIYTVSGMYNGTLTAVVIFVDAKIQFLLQISKQCQKFFSHRMEAFQLLEKLTYTKPIQQVQSYRLYDYMHKLMPNIYMTMTYKKPTYTKPIQRTLYMIVPDISPILIIEVWRRTPTKSIYSKPIRFFKL